MQKCSDAAMQNIPPCIRHFAFGIDNDTLSAARRAASMDFIPVSVCASDSDR
jgi:thymidylate synthase